MSLAGRHAGQVASIVGTGPSLLHLRPSDFDDGPVIVLNHAILQVRRLGLPNLLYSMQKDGCQIHNEGADIPLACVCPSDEMVQPEPPEILLLSAAESSGCFPDYPLRHVVDVEADLGVSWATSSSPVAVLLAALMGCTSVCMLAHDSYTSGDARRVVGTDVVSVAGQHYRGSAEQANDAALAMGVPITWAKSQVEAR